MMRWPWRKDPQVEEALTGSAERLEQVQKLQAELEPQLQRLRRNVERNHFEEAVTQVFRVVR